MPKTKKQKTYQKAYYIKNKEKKKAYNQEHQEKRRIYSKKWHKDNKEKDQIYRDTNKDKIAEQHKEYRQTPSGKKSGRISHWKYRGVICNDFDELYEKYINTKNCERCEVELTETEKPTKTTRCLDHDHETGLFRNIVCWNCNLNVLPKQTIIGEI